jgi:hypothetical protein
MMANAGKRLRYQCAVGLLYDGAGHGVVLSLALRFRRVASRDAARNATQRRTSQR